MTTSTAVPRLWPNSTVACIASGPSLTQQDCAYVRGKARVIAVNDGIRFTKDFADVLYSSDPYWWKHYRGSTGFRGMKVAVEQRPKHRAHYETWPDITALRNTGRHGLELSPDGLKTGENSGAAAINLAVHLGAARILLLGYNMGNVKGRSHFFGSHPPGLHNTDQRNYRLFLHNYELMVEPLKAICVQVINCTEPSALDCFPKMALREALPESAEVAA